MADRDPQGDGIPPRLAIDLIDLMAHQKMVEETRHLLSHCEPGDAIANTGSNFKLRLDILAIDDDLHTALSTQDRAHPSKYFECLLERFDVLRKTLANADKSYITEKWPSMRAAVVRQAALACMRAQHRDHVGLDPFDWGRVSTKGYIAAVNRLTPALDDDLDALDDEEQMTAAKERRNLMDVFLEKRSAPSSLKVRTLLRENNLGTFAKDLKAFTRELDAVLLPKPRLLQLYSENLLDEGSDEMHVEPQNRVAGHPASPASSAGSPSRLSSARTGAGKGGASAQGQQYAPESAQALAKANEHLQQEMIGQPGTVAEALGIGNSVPEPRSPTRKRKAVADIGGRANGERSPRNRSPARRGGRSITMRSSPGKQVNFDDSQSVDEPQIDRPSLHKRPTPERAPSLPVSTGAGSRNKRKTRTPWTEEEEKHLSAAVKALGKGRWVQALAQYKFQSCRTAVDLKDKWRNLTKP